MYLHWHKGAVCGHKLSIVLGKPDPSTEVFSELFPEALLCPGALNCLRGQSNYEASLLAQFSLRSTYLLIFLACWEMKLFITHKAGNF